MLKNNSDEYYKHIRHDIIKHFPRGSNSLIDIGCGCGYTGRYLKTKFNIPIVHGVEINEEMGREAQQYLDHVYICDANSAIEIIHTKYDCIILADVLEHLLDPWMYLDKLKSIQHSKTKLLISIPNISHIRIIIDLLFNKFEYKEEGILDKTHLRFFTINTIKELFEKGGYTIKIVGSNYSRTLPYKIFNLLSFGLLKYLITYQYIILATRND